jgi:hypothetical protein
MVVALVALVVALGGTSYAATQLSKNSVGPKQLKSSAVTTKKIKRNAVTSPKVRNGSLVAADFRAGQLKARGPAGGDLTGSYPNPEFGPVPAAQALTSTAQSVPNAAATRFNLSAATIDEGGMFSAELDALVVPRPGIYSLSGAVGWAADPDGSRQTRLLVDNVLVASTVDNAGGAGFIRQSVTALVRLSAGEEIRLGGYQTSGAALDTALNNPAVSLAAFWVGP